MSSPGRRRGTYHSGPAPSTSGLRAWVALGANLRDRRRTLERAARWLGALPETTLEARSSLHVTPALGPPQPDYLNAVVRLRTSLSPRRLLTALLTLEAAAGRTRCGSVRWGPRVLDLDLLSVEGRIVDDPPDLLLPHPRLQDRRFVLAPWGELDPVYVVPGLGRTVGELLARLGGGPEG